MASVTTQALAQDYVDGLMGMPVALEPGKIDSIALFSL